MKINEVEQKVGITKKNIRFYEQEGLLKPERNVQNGYREYSEEDLILLQKIKLLRKLSVPIEEIRKIETGTLTMDDALRRHHIYLEREQKNIEEMRLFCQMLMDGDERFSSLDASSYLEKMAHMEKEGTRFMNVQVKVQCVCDMGLYCESNGPTAHALFDFNNSNFVSDHFGYFVELVETI